ncbi:PHP domain-containing protein [Aureimonas pseudogalii]|uniref:Polymerase/histidinol phosphatase N-terminal domain-containing protein n=1 Tax=Aureimonas pseudogalii TaxID=1744844 RepID=A0A7W6E8N0_9HYPH|nr:CehA/McbA family metallohydrolase [Aureimonas pseudogalii]MBB3996786.1 hypothetical protein [Aureimonas pseudogalii]
MSFDAFRAPGQFRRANLHTHSTLSDGALAPEAVCAAYADRGYEVLCLSDHFTERFGFPVADTRAFRSEGFTTIFGAELHAPANSQGEVWHILACGLPLDFAPNRPGEDGVALARRAREAGAFVAIAHPQWSSLTIEDGRALAGIAHAVEIYNTGCDLECARPDGFQLLDALWNEGHPLTAYAADDAHFRIPDGFGGWTMVKAETNEPEAILAALKAGLSYSTMGPTLHDVAIEGDAVTVRCSPARNVALVGRGSRSENVFGDGLTEARLPLARFAGDWARVVVSDAAGRHAWSQPQRF